jgi:hypothetical protein
MIPIDQGRFNDSIGVYYNTDITPPNTTYIAYYYDANRNPIAGPSSPFSVTSDTFTPPALTLLTPADSAAAPVPDNEAGTDQFFGVVTPWAWNEVPAGTKDGVNTAFTLAETPAPAASLHVLFNGSDLTQGVDYTLSGTAITMVSPYIPTSTDTFWTFYAYGTSVPAFSEILMKWNETPAGLMNGSNQVFVLSENPYPTSSLILIFNGSTLRQGVDYVLLDNIINLLTFIPASGDTLVASFLYSRCFTRRGGVATWAFDEIPSGTKNSSNTVFTLANTPDPPASLMLRFNGSTLTQGVHYNLYGAIIVFNAPFIPAPSDNITADYQYFVYTP